MLADVSLFLVLISIFLGHVEENDYQVITENYDNYCVILKIYLYLDVYHHGLLRKEAKFNVKDEYIRNFLEGLTP